MRILDWKPLLLLSIHFFPSPVRVDETLITLPLLLNSSCPEKNRRQRTRNPRRYFCTRDRYSTNLISHRDGIRCVFRPNNGVAITKIAIHTRKHTFRSRDSPIRTIREYEEGKGSFRSRHRVYTDCTFRNFNEKPRFNALS